LVLWVDGWREGSKFPARVRGRKVLTEVWRKGGKQNGRKGDGDGEEGGGEEQ
jgi:hypothetical protein